MKFKDIPQFMDGGHYRIDVSWDYLEEWLYSHMNPGDGIAALDIDPDFQRAHVWTEAQQIAYVEFCLKGGKGSSEIKFNCVGWQGTLKGPFVLVDGKQRLNAVLRFLHNEIPAFGHLFKEYKDKMRWDTGGFSFRINDLKTREQVLQWYLEINQSGVPHTKEELDKVKNLLTNERKTTPKSKS